MYPASLVVCILKSLCFEVDHALEVEYGTYSSIAFASTQYSSNGHQLLAERWGQTKVQSRALTYTIYVLVCTFTPIYAASNLHVKIAATLDVRSDAIRICSQATES